MSRIKPVTLSEFLFLIEYAQDYHSTQNEPIPEVHESQYDKIRSCLEMPFQTFGGHLLYKGFHNKAALLFYLFNKNHALTNGNKRMACITMAFFCHKNKHTLGLEPQAFYNLAKSVSNSNPEIMEAVIKIIAKGIRDVER